MRSSLLLSLLCALVAGCNSTAPAPAPLVPHSQPSGIQIHPGVLVLMQGDSAQKVSVSLPGYSGKFQYQSACSTVALVSADPAGQQFAVAPLRPGSCSIIFSGDGATGSLYVKVMKLE